MHTHRGFCLPIFSTMQFAPCFFHAVLAHVGQSSCLVSSRPPVRFRQTAPSQRAVRPLPLPHHVAVFSKPQFFEKKKPRKTLRFKRSFAGFLELLTWFEQATCSLRVSCSTSWATVADKIFLHVLQREIFYHTSCALSRFDFAAEQVQIVCDAKI